MLVQIKRRRTTLDQNQFIGVGIGLTVIGTLSGSGIISTATTLESIIWFGLCGVAGGLVLGEIIRRVRNR